MSDDENVIQLHTGHELPPRDQRDWVLSTELQAEVGITYRQLDYWTRTGLITPLDAPEPGSGYIRRWPLSQIDRCIAIRELLNAGLGLQAIRQHADAFITHGHIQIGAITITRAPAEPTPSKSGDIPA